MRIHAFVAVAAVALGPATWPRPAGAQVGEPSQEAAGVTVPGRPTDAARSTLRSVSLVNRVAPLARTVADDLRRLPSRGNLILLGMAGTASLAVLAHDRGLTTRAAGSPLFDRVFEPGELLGGGGVQIGGALATFATGRLVGHRRIATVGADLMHVQFLNGLLTHTVKVAARRARPDGGAHSFPSGHTSSSFAAATVLDHHFGWKVGAPAHALAAFVGASRLAENRHFASDVVFGAAIGIVAGRAIRLGRGERHVVVAPVAAPGATGVSISWDPTRKR